MIHRALTTAATSRRSYIQEKCTRDYRPTVCTYHYRGFQKPVKKILNFSYNHYVLAIYQLSLPQSDSQSHLLKISSYLRVLSVHQCSTGPHAVSIKSISLLKEVNQGFHQYPSHENKTTINAQHLQLALQLCIILGWNCCIGRKRIVNTIHIVIKKLLLLCYLSHLFISF